MLLSIRDPKQILSDSLSLAILETLAALDIDHLQNDKELDGLN